MTKMYFYIDRKNRINQVGNRKVLESNNIDLFDIVDKYNLRGDFPYHKTICSTWIIKTW